MQISHSLVQKPPGVHLVDSGGEGELLCFQDSVAVLAGGGVCGHDIRFSFSQVFAIPALGPLIVGCIFAWIMIGVVVVDMEHMIIPDRFSMGGAIGGVLLSMAFPSIHQISQSTEFLDRLGGGMHSLVGLLVGSACLYWIGILAEKALNKEALGEGDVKLLGCIGAFCGWKGAIFAIFGGATLGALVLLPVMVVGRWRANGKEDAESITWGQEVPLGLTSPWRLALFDLYPVMGGRMV